MFARLSTQTIVVLLVIAGGVSSPMRAQSPAAHDKISITTSSEEARKLYVDGRDLLEKLRVTDARHLFEQSVAKDPTFALGYVGLANSSTPSPVRSNWPATSATGNGI